MAKRPTTWATLSQQARADVEDILLWSEEQFGVAASERYEELLIQALRDLSEDPQRHGVRERPELAPGLCSYHLASSRNQVVGHRVKEPRHFVIFRQPPAHGGLEIIRILHDSRDLARHVSSVPPL